MTLAEKSRLAGFNANLRVRGRTVTAEPFGKKITVLVDDQAIIAEPDETAKARLPVYVLIFARLGAVPNPRDVSRFVEPDGRWHEVIEFRETVADSISNKWLCETQRKDFTNVLPTHEDE